MAAIPPTWNWARDIGIGLGFISCVCAACLGLSFAPRLFEASVAQELAQRYVLAISRSDAAAAEHQCQELDQGIIAAHIAHWGGTEIQDVHFAEIRRSSTSNGVERVLNVTFSYRYPGQTTWQRQALHMLWTLHDLEWWEIPSSETCWWVQLDRGSVTSIRGPGATA
jgi:hypothetical protein